MVSWEAEGFPRPGEAQIGLLRRYGVVVSEGSGDVRRSNDAASWLLLLLNLDVLAEPGEAFEDTWRLCCQLFGGPLDGRFRKGLTYPLRWWRNWARPSTRGP